MNDEGLEDDEGLVDDCARVSGSGAARTYAPPRLGCWFGCGRAFGTTQALALGTHTLALGTHTAGRRLDIAQKKVRRSGCNT